MIFYWKRGKRIQWFGSGRTCGDFSDFCVELHVDVFLFSEHDGVLEIEVEEDDNFVVIGLVEGVLDVVVQDVDTVTTDWSVPEQSNDKLLDFFAGRINS